MGKLIFFQDALEKQQKKTPANVKMLYHSLKASGWGQLLIKLAIAAATVELNHSEDGKAASVNSCYARETQHG